MILVKLLYQIVPFIVVHRVIYWVHDIVPCDILAFAGANTVCTSDDL